MVDVPFLNRLIERHRSENAQIYITDNTTRILAATQEERVGTKGRTAGYILGIGHAAAIDNAAIVGLPAQDVGSITYGTPIQERGVFWGAVIVHAPASQAAQIGNTLKTALETALEYETYRRQAVTSKQDELQRVAQLMLAQQVDHDTLLPLMLKYELDPELLRTVICIRLDYHENSYFNINLNLGYRSSFEQLREEVARIIRRSRPLNSQDLVYVADRNTLLVIKAFLQASDLSKLYLALDVVCQDLAATLRNFSAFSFSIAYGNLYSDINDLHQSWREAEETLSVGRQISYDEEIYSLDKLLFESVYRHLQPQVVKKILEPALQKLTRKDGTVQEELIYCCEAFVDNGMSLSRTAVATQLHRNTISARLEKLQTLTGLDPATSFKDAFLTKMLAVSVKQMANTAAD